MATVPNGRLGKLQFYEAHITPWTDNAAAIGLAPADVASLALATGQARVAYNAMLAARDAAKAATQNFYDKVELMHAAPGAGSDMIDTIKNFAQTSDDPNVYVLAQIPAPTPPGQVPPPGTPFDFRVGLLQDGSLEIKWKCSNPAGAPGTVYEIMRSDAGGPLVYVDSAGVKSYVDDGVPANSGPVTYQITAVRSTLRGNPAQFTVQFGAGGGVQEGGASEGGLSIAA